MNAREPFVLGDWTVDPTTGTLSGPAGVKRLTPKLTDLLTALVQRAGQVVGRDELLRSVWGERSAVADEPLTRAVAELRRLLGDIRADPTYIETIPKRGYRLIARVAAGTAAASAGEPAAAPAATPAASSPAEQDATRAAATPGSTPRTARPWRTAAVALIAAGSAAGGVALAIALLVRTLPAVVGPAQPVSVAVLPFADLSPAADHQYFADGVHEEIIVRLTGIPELRVATRSTVSSYRDRGVRARDVARELGVDAVMEGSVRYADARVRVIAQLIDAATDKHLWSETFDRPLTLTNLFDIQAEIADGVAAGLTRSLAVNDVYSAPPLPTANLASYEAFLLGKYHYRRRQPGDVERAIEQFQAAVDADAAFALAWDWLGYAWIEAGVDLNWATPARAFPRARAAALRALELDPGLATASALIGFLRATYDWDWQAGLDELERAAAAAPDETGTVWSYAYVLSLLGRHDEAIAAVTALAARFPRDGRLQQEVAERLIDAEQFAAAVERANVALGSGAELGQIHELLGIAAFGAGDEPAALTELERAVALQHGGELAVGRLAATYARAGRADDARRLLAELETKSANEELNVTTLARVYTALGERERALALLAHGVEERHRDALGIGNDPFFAALRGDPQFAALVGRMGLALTDR